MSFVHDDPEWPQLLRIVADSVGRPIALVEKDYWVVHTLWAMLDQGFEVWFKGGTSLSKGFDLIERFSEDIDVRMDAGRTGLREPTAGWTNTKGPAVAQRDSWFDTVAEHLDVPGCHVERDADASDPKVRSASLRVIYPSLHSGELPGAMRAFVLLEVGRARVTPYVEVDLSSWVHDHLHRDGQLERFQANRPRQVWCIHPWVTCLEKIDAIAGRFDKAKPAGSFVRHYEDVVRILRARERLPQLGCGLSELGEELSKNDQTVMPPADHASLRPDGSERWREIQAAWEAVAPMFWGDRIPLAEACSEIRAFLEELSQGTT